MLRIALCTITLLTACKAPRPALEVRQLGGVWVARCGRATVDFPAKPMLTNRPNGAMPMGMAELTLADDHLAVACVRLTPQAAKLAAAQPEPGLRAGTEAVKAQGITVDEERALASQGRAVIGHGNWPGTGQRPSIVEVHNYVLADGKFALTLSAATAGASLSATAAGFLQQARVAP